MNWIIELFILAILPWTELDKNIIHVRNRIIRFVTFIFELRYWVIELFWIRIIFIWKAYTVIPSKMCLCTKNMLKSGLIPHFSCISNGLYMQYTSHRTGILVQKHILLGMTVYTKIGRNWGNDYIGIWLFLKLYPCTNICFYIFICFYSYKYKHIELW